MKIPVLTPPDLSKMLEDKGCSFCKTAREILSRIRPAPKEQKEV